MRAKHPLYGDVALGGIRGVHGEQRFPLHDPIPHLMMNDDANGVVDRITFDRAATA